MNKTLATIAGLLFTAVAWSAEPVVLPEFSYDSTDNFALSVMLQNQVMDRLIADGHIVLNQEVVAREVGDAAVDRCMENPTCPGELLPRLPARVAVVTRIARTSGSLLGHVEIWEQSRTTAMEVLDIPVAPGEEQLFVDEVSVATNRLLGQLPPSSTETLMAAARLIAGGTAAAAPPVGPSVPQPQPGQPQPVIPTPVVPQPVLPGPAPPTPVVAAPKPAPVRGRGIATTVDYSATEVRAALEGTGIRYRHVTGAQGSLRRSGQDPRTWMFRATPHSGRLVFEARAGMGIGDVDRQADVRLALNSGEKAGEWYQEGPIPARRVRGGVYVGYAPTAMLDVGAMFGIQYGKRWYTTGFFIVDEDEGATSELASVDAVQFVLQPRLRLYVVPTGPAKPFVFVAGDFRMFDRYKLAVPEGPQYPSPAGGVVPGVAGGGGLLIDPSPIFGFFVEGSYIRHFGLRSGAARYLDWAYGKPDSPVGGQFTISAVGGVQFRL